MALAFQVTTPDRVFVPDYAEEVIAVLWDRFGVRYVGDDERPRLWSEEIGRARLRALQELAPGLLGPSRSPQLAACDPFQTVYLPLELAPEPVAVAGEALVVGSVLHLREELQEIGRAQRWPVDLDSLQATAARSARPPAPPKAAYLQLARMAEEAVLQDLPLWAVET